MKNQYDGIVIKFLPFLIAAVVLTTLVSVRGQIKTEFKRWQMANSGVLTELSSKEFIDRILASDGKFDSQANTAVWFNHDVPVPGNLENIIASLPQNVLGESTGNKWIEIDLTTQHLYAHEGDRIAFDFPISSGLPWLPTVTGEFHIWAKIRSQRMTGGQVENGTFYDLPNVPFVQYFHNGYGLHGAYWHNDFGHPRSHGCVNISIPNSERLYYWTDPVLGPNEYARYSIDPGAGTRVVVHGNTPTNIY